MAGVNTKSKRNAALKDAVGILFPSGTIDAPGRQTLVGDYWTAGGPPPPIVGGSEFDYAEKPWSKEPNSFGFDERMIPKC